MDKTNQVDHREPRLHWLVIFMLNLLIPFVFGLILTKRGGLFGMITAIGLLWLIGHHLCGKSKPLASLLSVGGGIVALTQFCPILQIFAGIMGLSLAQLLEPDRDWDVHPPVITTVLGGFLATFATGGLLIGAALFIGWVAQAFLRWIRPQPRSVSSRMYDRELDG